LLRIVIPGEVEGFSIPLAEPARPRARAADSAVMFRSGTNEIGTATLIGAAAKLTKSPLSGGTYPITAQYLGDATSGKSTSPVANQVAQ
jgi:hypothetical protein